MSQKMRQIRTAMILAAGLGTRMGTLTARRPKVLLPLNGLTILEVLLRKLRNSGISRVVINAHHRREVLREFVQRYGEQGLQIQLSEEETLLDTGGGIAFAERFFAGETLLVVNGDVLSDISLAEFEGAFLERKPLAALAVVPTNGRQTYSLVHYSEEGRLLGFLPPGAPLPSRGKVGIYTGFQILTPAARAYLKPRPESIITALYRRALQDGQFILVYEHRGRWLDLGTRDRYQHILSRLKQGEIQLADFGQ